MEGEEGQRKNRKKGEAQRRDARTNFPPRGLNGVESVKEGNRVNEVGKEALI